MGSASRKLPGSGISAACLQQVGVHDPSAPGARHRAHLRDLCRDLTHLAGDSGPVRDPPGRNPSPTGPQRWSAGRHRGGTCCVGPRGRSAPAMRGPFEDPQIRRCAQRCCGIFRCPRYLRAVRFDCTRACSPAFFASPAKRSGVNAAAARGCGARVDACSSSLFLTGLTAIAGLGNALQRPGWPPSGSVVRADGAGGGSSVPVRLRVLMPAGQAPREEAAGPVRWRSKGAALIACPARAAYSLTSRCLWIE